MTAQPVIGTFSADQDTIIEGQKVTLSWSTTDAKSLSISPGVGTVRGTSVMVSPKVTTTYTLTAANGKNKSKATVAVKVNPVPKIAKFTLSRAKTYAGAAVTLTWKTANATTLSIDQGVGAVTGSSGSINVTPEATTIYTLTATSDYGTVTATVTVQIGDLPVINSFAPASANVGKGKSTTLTWDVANAGDAKKYPFTISPGVGKVRASTVKVTLKATTTYTLTATNDYGSVTAMTTVNVGALPIISSFKAAPAGLVANSGDSSTLSWTVSGADALSIDNGVGAVTGTSTDVAPAQTTKYTLTATNIYGSSTATATVTVGDLPVISGFVSNPNIEAGPGVSGLLTWSTTGATKVSIDNGVGVVSATKSNFKVTPTKKTTYTLTATNAVGSVTATATVTYRPLKTVNSHLYYSEHCLFVIPDAHQVNWTGSDSYDSVYSDANLTKYVASLKTQFPDDYTLITIAANNLQPNSVPNVFPRRRMADGIGQDAITGGTGVPDICRYNIGGGTVIDGCLGVLDHEIGHVWGIFLGLDVRNEHGHWFANSTVNGQMAEVYSNDSYQTVKQITGDSDNGFHWDSVDNLVKNQNETFSEQDLYLMGLAASFPDFYILQTPVYNADKTVSSPSVAKYDQAWIEKNYGVRSPDYKASTKKFRIGFVYVARDLAEVRNVYQPFERSINHFANAEAIDTNKYRFQVPFLVDTKFRASVDARLADLDGNATPTLSITGPTYMASSDGSASIYFIAADKDGTVPEVSCVPAVEDCTVTSNCITVRGLSSGTHFLTIKAQDAGGKKCFAHCVVDVQ